MLDLKKTLAKLLNCDYVIEEGTEGIWTYRKWASGIAECWGEKTFSFSGFAQWGQVYSYDIAVSNYPSGLFISKPNLVAQAQYTGGNSWSSIEGGGTETYTPGVIMIRGTAQSTATSGIVYYQARGFWKTFTPIENNT